jgi:hypothetical protein
MPSAGFKPMIALIKQPQIYALNHTMQTLLLGDHKFMHVKVYSHSKTLLIHAGNSHLNTDTIGGCEHTHFRTTTNPETASDKQQLK